MGVWRRLLGLPERAAPAAVEPARSADMNFQDYVDLLGSFGYGGVGYPILNTTYGTGRDEEQIAATTNAAYKANGITFALVLARLQVFSQIRFQWTRFQAGRPADLFGTPELQILERPWPGGTTADLLARMEVDVSLAGNAYIRRRGRRLHRLRPDWVAIILGSNEDADHPDEAGDVEVAGYLYKPGGWDSDNRAIALLPEQVAHYAPIPDPDANFLGMSWITPAMRDVVADDAMTIHKRKFLENAATPNLAIRFDPQITPKAVREFKEIFDSEHRGVWNAWKTWYLGGGADPVVIGKDFRELDFAVTQGKAESRMASAAGVPPSWVGFSEGLQGSALNAGNFGAARRRYGDGTLQHLWRNAAASLETILSRPDDGAYLWFDTQGVPFLREDSKDAAEIQAREASTITALVRDGFTPESTIAAVRAQDWTLLQHTGLLSVQLQEPGQQPDSAAAGAAPSSDGGSDA